MRSNYIQFNSPQFRVLSDKQIEELHLATLQILERTGVTFECEEAIKLLGEAGIDVSNPKRVKIPSYLVEQALRTTPETITLYTRDGEMAMTLNGTGCHFGGNLALDKYLDPYTRQPRRCYVKDIGDMARVFDALPNIEWAMNTSDNSTIPGAIADKVGFLHTLLNTTKPIVCQFLQISSVEEMRQVAAIVAGGEKELRAKPFFVGSSLSVSPLFQGENAMQVSLICAEKLIPNVVYNMPIGGATAPAGFPAILALGNAEFLSQLVVIQLKRPGAPVIYGSQPGILDMKTTIYAYGAPEAHFLDAALTQLGRYYGLPVYGTAGQSDTDVVGAQAATEATYQILLGALSGADFLHGLGEMDIGRMASPEYAVLANEIIDMVKVVMGGIEINAETLPLDLIEKVGPGGTFISEKHTLKNFRRFWSPTVFDRTMAKNGDTKRCEELLNEKAIQILETHRPKPLPDTVLKELEKIEKRWLKEVGLKAYPEKI